MQFYPVSREPEHFQQSLLPQQVDTICRRAFGETVRVASVRELSSGLFNNTYIVEIEGMAKAVLRIAPAPTSHLFPNERFLMRREHTVQPYLAAVCPQVPHTLFADFTHQLIGRDYVFQTFVAGEVWGAVRDTLTPVENDAIRRQLGGIARQINSVRGDTFGNPWPDPGFARWSEALVHFLTGMHEELGREGLETDGSGRLLQWVTTNAGLFDEIREPRLLHGDLWPQNILIERKPGGAEIVGVLDSERAMWGDPLFEWIYHLGTTHPAYWEGFGQRDESEGARLRALAYKGIWQVLVCMEHLRFRNDAAWARNGLTQVLAELQV